METLLIRIKDKSKADAVSSFLKEMGIVEEIKTISHWEEDGEKLIGKIGMLPLEKQQILLMQLNREELLAQAHQLDAAITPSSLSEEEIVSLCRKARKELNEL